MLRTKLLRILRSTRQPIPTPDLVALVGTSRANVVGVLRYLMRLGLVSRVVKVMYRKPARGVCLVCKKPRAIYCRDACHRCWMDKEKRPTGDDRRAHTIAFWTATIAGEG